MPDDAAFGYTIADTPPPETDDEAIVRLARLLPLDYERCRSAEAASLGCRRVGELDKLVQKARSGAEAVADRGVRLHDPEPWPDPVATDAMLDDLVAALKRHVILPPSAADAIALWISHTWVAERFEHTPRLGITSPIKRCGKSTLLELLRMTCRRTLKADNISASGVFRTVEALRPLTLVIDETDSFLSKAEELRGVLNSGFERSGSVIRVVEIRGEHQPVQFATFAPCALACIGDLPSTLADRSLPVRMKRKAAGEIMQKLRQGGNRADLVDLARKLARWAVDTAAALSTEPAVPEAMGDREGDISTPLLAIADHAGGAWAARGRRALLDLFRVQAAEEGNAEVGALLLSDLRMMFAGADEMPSSQIVKMLGEMDTRPWPEWGKAMRPITMNQLARVLKPFSIGPTTYRPNGGGPPVKGYLKVDFEDAWNRYLPAGPSSTAPKPETDPLQGNIAIPYSGCCEKPIGNTRAPVTDRNLRKS